MNNNTELQDFSLNSNPNTRVSGANTYQFHNYTNTPIVYIGNNPRVAEAVAQSEAERTGSYDPYALASKKAYSAAYSQAPKVGISNGKITVTAPQTVLDSTYYQQLNKELQSLKGADLSSPNVQYAIDKLNEEIQNNFQEAAVKNTIGWALDELNDYQYAMQTVRSANPMKSSNKIKGRDKDGNVVAKTPKEWSNYWREAYNANDRYDAFEKSAQSSDPYDRTMYLVLSAGGGSPKYGFDWLDRLSQGKDAAKNQMAKLPEGTFRTLFGNTDKASLVDSDQKKFNIPVKAFTNNSITNDLQFSQKLQELWGKKWEELSPEDKAFVLILSRTSKEDAEDRDLASKGRIRIEQLEGMYPNTTLQPEIQNMDSSDAVARILFHANFDDYKRIRDSYVTWTDWQEQMDADDKRLAKNAEWAPLEIGGGNIVGTIGRYLWEAAIVHGLTGGIGGKPELVNGKWEFPGVQLNSISDRLGESIMSSLAAKGIAPASKAGQALLTFAANLAGTIPEDILQTAIDNVLTYNEEENAHLFDLDNMSENLRNNLIVMALFNAAKAGWSTLRLDRVAREAAKRADLEQIIDIKADIDDIRRAYDKGGKIEIEGDTVKAVDGDGNEVVLKNITPEAAENIKKVQGDVDTAKLVEEGISPKVEVEGETVKAVEPESPDVKASADTAKIDYEYAPLTKAMSVDVEPTSVKIKDWHTTSLNNIMRNFDNFLYKFQDKFGDVQASDFDWIWYNSRFQHLSPEKIIGTTDPTTGRVVTQEMIDAAKWWAEQPEVKAMRQASIKSLGNTIGKNSDFNILGYLPHTSYDPSDASFEEALAGVLWRRSSGASIMDEGKYKGYGGDFKSRYKTFASNMLWDARAKDVATAKLLDEVRMDGQEITPEVIKKARKAVDGERNIQKLVNDTGSTKELVGRLESTTKDIDTADAKKIEADAQKQAEKMGLSRAYHDNYDFYSGADSHNVTKQSGAFGNNFDSLGNIMKNTIVDGVGSMYDNGGADLLYAVRNAIDIVNRYIREGGNLRDMLQEYVENHSHRSPKYAAEIVDKWMRKLGDVQGPLTKAKAVQVLGNSMKWESMSRLKRWLALAKYDQFNASTRKTMDRLLFSHVQTDIIQNNSEIIGKLAKVLDTLTSLRYRALFYGNLKNALLQTSELNRYFTSFKLGDVASMAKRLATDEAFRAKVDDYVQAIAPMSKQAEEAFRNAGVRPSTKVYKAYSNIAENMDVKSDSVVFNKLKNAKETADAIGLGPIETAENFKNRMMVAALVAESDNLGLSGDEALRHIRNRFERVALAADEMGQIGFAANPIARTALFLQNFQIRELGMHYYNIKDATGMAGSVPKSILAAANYATKVLGSKLATTLILARLGYSASQTLGYDPFGLLDQYDELNQEDMENFDYFMKYNPLFLGGMTSLISDVYFMGRKAYEESNQETAAEEAEQRSHESWGWEMPKLSWEDAFPAAATFIPGSVFANRLNQMNEMMDTGWAMSDSGNKMYSKPDDALNTVLGYLFGRSATQNAQQYNQTYGDNLWQTLGRFLPGRKWGDFDPIDAEYYSDWFKGNENDGQQFSKGIYWFRNQRDQIIDTYEDAISKSYSGDEIAEAKNQMNERLGELYNKLERFVDAYEKKNGTISQAMAKQVINVLNTYRNSTNDSDKERETKSREGYNKALERYSNLGLSPVGTYSGPTTDNPHTTEDESAKETTYQGSPQWRAAVSGHYDVANEAVDVLKEVDKTLSQVRNEIKDDLSEAYNVAKATGDYSAVNKIQKQYLKAFDNAVSPVIAAYGNSILKSTAVADQLRDMLSTGTNKKSANLIPSEQYAKNKYGRYQSMEYESVDVGKWAQKRFSGDTYTKPTITSNTSAAEDLSEIKKLIRRGQNDRARARALQLKVRVDNQQRYLSKDDYNWLNDYINYKEGK